MSQHDDQPTARAGRVNIAFTRHVEPAVRRLQEAFHLASLLDVAKLAIAYALREDIPLERPGDFATASGVNYNIGSIDPQGELRSLLLALHPELADDPYRVLETLMNEGARRLDGELSAASILTLRDLLQTGA